jgi:ACR3 family arsenite efflux pump ArsB
LGGGLLTVLALNLIVMLTPLLFVPGLKVTFDMMKQLFKRNKLMFIICGVIILFSPFMVVALSGCYAVFGQMLKSFLEKRGIGS